MNWHADDAPPFKDKPQDVNIVPRPPPPVSLDFLGLPRKSSEVLGGWQRAYWSLQLRDLAYMQEPMDELMPLCINEPC